MFRQSLLAIAIVVSSATSVKAGWNGLSDEEVQNCVNHIYHFQQTKQQEELDIRTRFSGLQGTFGRDLAILYTQYEIELAYIEAESQCGGSYNLKSIAHAMYRDNYLSTPYVTDRLNVR